MSIHHGLRDRPIDGPSQHMRKRALAGKTSISVVLRLDLFAHEPVREQRAVLGIPARAGRIDQPADRDMKRGDPLIARMADRSSLQR